MSNTFLSWFLLSTLFVGLSIFSYTSNAQTFDINGVSSGEIRDNVQLYLKDVNKPVSEFDLDDYRESFINKHMRPCALLRTMMLA